MRGSFDGIQDSVDSMYKHLCVGRVACALKPLSDDIIDTIHSFDGIRCALLIGCIGLF